MTMDEYLARARALACMSPLCAKTWNALQDDIGADVDALLAYAIASKDTQAAMVLMTMADD
jgi:hypothetical protein